MGQQSGGCEQKIQGYDHESVKLFYHHIGIWWGGSFWRSFFVGLFCSWATQGQISEPYPIFREKHTQRLRFLQSSSSSSNKESFLTTTANFEDLAGIDWIFKPDSFEAALLC